MVFDHISIRTSNMERSLEFYRKFFDMRLVAQKEIPKNNAEIAFLQDAGADFSLEITWYKGQSKFEQTEYDNRVFDHLAFAVDDLRSKVEEIRSAGFEVTDEPFELAPGRWLAFVEDPDGVLIELIQR